MKDSEIDGRPGGFESAAVVAAADGAGAEVVAAGGAGALGTVAGSGAVAVAVADTDAVVAVAAADTGLEVLLAVCCLKGGKRERIGFGRETAGAECDKRALEWAWIGHSASAETSVGQERR